MKLCDLQFSDIPKMSKAFKKGLSKEEKKNSLSLYMDSTILDNLGYDMIGAIFDVTRKIVENRCRELIQEHTGEEALSEGTNIRLKNDFGSHKKGDILTISNVNRFEDDVFGQGWYTYEADGLVLYPREFEVVGN